jgi:hypothetical protein
MEGKVKEITNLNNRTGKFGVKKKPAIINTL